MTNALFIRTFWKDAEFLGYLMRSLDKYCKGFDRIVVNCDGSDRHVIEPIVAGRADVVTTNPVLQKPYYEQQYRKHTADELCGTDTVTFVDSDCIAWREMTPQHFQRDGRGEIIITPFDHLGMTVPWRPATEKAMGERCEFETMRGMHLQARSETLRECRAWMHQKHNMPLDAFMARTPNYSEFNVIFNWALKFHRDKYYWLDTTKEALPSNHPLDQTYSGNGVTPEIREKWERYLA